MKKLFAILGLIVIVGMIASVSAIKPNGPSAVNGLNGKGQESQLYLYEKDANWNAVEGGAWGKLVFSDEKFVFNGHGLVVGEEYTLINYCGWPKVQVFETGFADEGGNIHLAGNFVLDENCKEKTEGYKIWLVDSSDLSGTNLVAWHPAEYLFEYALII